MGALASSEGAGTVTSAPSSRAAGTGPVDGAASVGQRQVVVPVLAASLAGLTFASYATLADRVIGALMAIVLVVIGAQDLERRIIPNRIVLPATAIVLTGRIATAPGHSAEWIFACLGVGLFFLIPNLINSSAIGMGDVKLGMFLGAGLGVAVVGALIVAFVSMFPFAVGTLVRGGRAARKSTLPFGPFLAFGGLVILIVPRLVG